MALSLTTYLLEKWANNTKIGSSLQQDIFLTYTLNPQKNISKPNPATH